MFTAKRIKNGKNNMRGVSFQFNVVPKRIELQSSNWAHKKDLLKIFKTSYIRN